MIDRQHIVSRVAAFASARHWPLFVGNGYLAREIMAIAGPGDGSTLPLQGGMGLAGAVAAGFVLASPASRAVVLEGDGNHLMGWSSAQFIGFLRLPIIHVVSCNGSYGSTGGQAVPRRDALIQATATAAVLGYEQGLTAESEPELESALESAAACSLPTLVYAAENPASASPPRRQGTTASYGAGIQVMASGDDPSLCPGRRRRPGPHADSPPGSRPPPT